MTKDNVTKATKLPAGILAADLKYPKRWKDCEGIPFEDRSFELWYTTGFGWCIPTLLIARASRRYGVPQNRTDRTYAITVDTKQTVRIGKGPHVLKTLQVHVRKARLKALQPYLDLRRTGQAASGEVRDRISSRRAKGVLMRAAGRSSWYWSDPV